MTREVQDLLQRAMTLSATDRAELAGSLLDTLEDAVDEDVEIAWQEETARRLRDLESGEAQTVPWTDVRRGLVAKLPTRG
ncbi:MAG: addiction module protein [Candidatus Korobacteraceae bacterium]